MNKTIKYLILVFLIGLMVCPLIFAQEVIVSYELDSLPVLNRELDRTRERLRAIEDDATVDLTDEVTGILPLDNGGTGSELVDPDADRIGFWDDSAGEFTWLTAGTNLSITGTNLNNDISLAGLSNVIFTWSGVEAQDDDNYGILTSDSVNGHYQSMWYAVVGSVYRNAFYFQYKHSSDISTISIHARLKSSSSDENYGARLKVTINTTLNNNVLREATTFAWADSSTINVSTLTDGTTYEGIISLRSDGSFADPIAYCSAITLIAN